MSDLLLCERDKHGGIVTECEESDVPTITAAELVQLEMDFNRIPKHKRGK